MLRSIVFLAILRIAHGKPTYTYSKHAQGWLKLHQGAANFTDAFLRCDREGAILASPSDVGLQKALQLTFQGISDPCAIYTGIHKTFSYEDYTTIEGTPLAKLPVEWTSYHGESPNQHCAVMLENGSLASEWCNETHPFVCYKKNVNRTAVNDCGTIYNGYKLDSRTGSCYKHNKTETTWRRAFSTCLAEGAYLAIINSDTEAVIMKEMTKSSMAFIGFIDWNMQGLWYTVHGQTLQDAGYAKWGGAGYGDNSKGVNPLGEHCGSVGFGLNDISCDHVYSGVGFICEKNPDDLTVAK